MTQTPEHLIMAREPSGAPHDAAAAMDFLASALSRPLAASELVALTIPAPSAPAERLLGAEPGEAAVLWSPASDGEFCGLGAVRVFEASGPGRFETIRQHALELWRGLESRALDGPAPAPRLFGGFAFQSGRASSDSWQGFGEARFVLPEIGYARDAGRGRLTLIVPAAERGGRRTQELLARVERCLAALAVGEAAAGPPLGARREERSLAEWTELIARIQEEIASGRLQKVVAARRVRLELERAVDPASVLARLRIEAPECTRFAFRVAGACFLGATPERLIRKRGLEIESEAVAGSVRAEDAGAARRLLESTKDISEHEFVVRGLISALEPWTAELSASPPREIHQLRHVLHLRTRIRGRLREPRHVLDLVADLHPTPAVGGVPTRAALEFIAAHEPDERGWYAGPVGFFDPKGDGEFVVALRSGVLTPERAELYVGAGIVRDSDAVSEFAETRWKALALESALGVQM